MACLKIWENEVPVCTEALIIGTELGSGIYKVVITDKFNQKYERDLPIAYNSLEVDLTDYPNGLFTVFSKVTLQIFDDCDLQLIGCEDYDTIGITFVTSDSNETEFELCCN